ncbi:MAG: hypothetical protein IKH39_00645 [Candidatus Methanomethylophilaceae archaeon]|nr:hypothetical protein [Candidatus Methanomethylophilaceae archaeon]MBR4225554.1 hypothetical protein [Candidatus Methanomethylophilaceae archaeon]
MKTGVKGDPDAVRAKLDPWESDGGVARYYHKRWPEYLTPEQLSSYRSEYGERLGSPRPSVGVYSDSEFWLHIDGYPIRG